MTGASTRDANSKTQGGVSKYYASTSWSCERKEKTQDVCNRAIFKLQ
jgi:hypothetical protein